MRLRLSPDVLITIGAQVKRAGETLISEPAEFTVVHHPDGDEMDAYERLLGDALDGDPMLFAREDCVEAAWAVVDPVLGNVTPVHSYEHQSWGPLEAEALAARRRRLAQPARMTDRAHPAPTMTIRRARRPHHQRRIVEHQVRDLPSRRTAAAGAARDRGMRRRVVAARPARRDGPSSRRSARSAIAWCTACATWNPYLITESLLDDLRSMSTFVPEHLPGEIALIEAIRDRLPSVPQVACFDTAFHRGMPRVAKMIAIPRRFDAMGVQRYGFHGLSYSFLVEELARVGGASAARGRVILAHLGNGASLAAVRDGKSVDTSMGFTPASGLMMGTRAGDVDPGLVAFLARTEGMTAERFERMASHESGLLGVSETSCDMRALLARETTDVRAAEAVALFCYQAKKWVGAFAAALGGLDTLVFAGGIGEHAPVVRSRICDGLGFLGVELDAEANRRNEAVISAIAGRVTRPGHSHGRGADDRTLRVSRARCRAMTARAVHRSRGAPR